MVGDSEAPSRRLLFRHGLQSPDITRWCLPPTLSLSLSLTLLSSSFPFYPLLSPLLAAVLVPLLSFLLSSPLFAPPLSSSLLYPFSPSPSSPLGRKANTLITLFSFFFLSSFLSIISLPIGTILFSLFPPPLASELCGRRTACLCPAAVSCA